MTIRHGRRADRLWLGGGAVATLALGVATVAYLLARFPYDGLYGQDSYAYYYQAIAFRQELLGEPATPGQLYTTTGLYHWPVGYHLLLLLGFLLGGVQPVGGRLLTLFATLGSPVILYAISGRLMVGSPGGLRALAGLVAGTVLLLTGTYMRFGLSLMADVPALFAILLGTYCWLRACSAQGNAPARVGWGWALGAGLALGAAVLMRYGSAVVVAPLLVYLALSPAPGVHARVRLLGWAALGLALALVPQAAYLLTHEAGPGYGETLAGWNVGNLFRRTVAGPDGSATYDQPMIVFYLLSPLGDQAAGFLSRGLLPALGLGIGALVTRRRWAGLGFLLSWWIIPALVFSGTVYQAHRFVLSYLPAAAVAIGIGAALAAEWLLAVATAPHARRALARGLAGLLVLLGAALGGVQDARATSAWAATQAGFQASEQQVVALAQQAAGPPGGTPRAVAFGITAALYHYTGWPVVDLFLQDEAALARFYAAPGPRLLIVPEASLATQWAGTPVAARWAWLQAHYTLTRQGVASGYTVYTVAPR
ncbi:MAG TPA: phospholipid carrier-dependent glycosyltransferase [Chloroflexia bacterium]|nr:phospholipid carrier-dependent glycosyltransferase [Chloroflexia bacterium]